MTRAVIVGAGAFGVSTALELRARGFDVIVVDPGPLPHPDAATNDLTKLVRGDYGGDLLYTDLFESAVPRWREDDRRRVANGERALFHETGFLVLSSEPMCPGGFEYDSHAALVGRGYPLERLDGAAIRRRFPVLGEGAFSDGYYNPVGGWAESGAVLASEVNRARRAGIGFEEGCRVASLVESAGRTTGVRLASGRELEADVVVVAAGTWTATLLPELGDCLRSTGHPVFVFRPERPERFSPPSFVPWAADIGRTGWYGFALTGDGVVKVANHGPGLAQHPDLPRHLADGDEARCRTFLRSALPELAEAAVVATRLCFYGDSFDGDFVVAAHPERPGVVVAAGDSGHAFKFMPVLGELVADAVEGRENMTTHRFRFRERGSPRAEQARCRQ